VPVVAASNGQPMGVEGDAAACRLRILPYWAVTEVGSTEMEGFEAVKVDPGGAEVLVGTEDMVGLEGAVGVKEVALTVAVLVGEAVDAQAVIKMAIIITVARTMALFREDILYSFLFVISSISD